MKPLPIMKIPHHGLRHIVSSGQALTVFETSAGKWGYSNILGLTFEMADNRSVRAVPCSRVSITEEWMAPILELPLRYQGAGAELVTVRYSFAGEFPEGMRWAGTVQNGPFVGVFAHAAGLEKLEELLMRQLAKEHARAGL